MATTITIRNVPEDVRDELAARAARSGQSLQEYMLGQVVSMAAHPSPRDLMESVRRRKEAAGTHLEAADILRWRDEDRAAR